MTLGGGKYSSRSRRPGRRRAESIASGRLVAPITITSPLKSTTRNQEIIIVNLLIKYEITASLPRLELTKKNL